MCDIVRAQGCVQTPWQPLVQGGALPPARVPVQVRSATGGGADLAFIDHLQKMHSHMVGWMPTRSLEGHIAGGIVLIAEEAGGGEMSTPHQVEGEAGGGRTPLGYVIARDRYMKRDDVGIIYQLNVLPLKQRSLIGAMLVKSVFERSAYGCRLFSCWCAQDLAANMFWESIGFVPLAFRTGSRGKQRIHIFWQKRIREGDDGSASAPGGGGTPWWFPSKTEGGAVAEDRIVLPIPPGVHWRDAKPVVLPPTHAVDGSVAPALPAGGKVAGSGGVLAGGALVRPRPQQPKLTAGQKAAVHRMHSRHLGGVPLGRKAVLTASGIRYVERTDYVVDEDPGEGGTAAEIEALDIAEGRKKPKKTRAKCAGGQRAKHDPEHIARAREVRDRFLEGVNSGALVLEASNAKYDVRRQLPDGGGVADAALAAGDARMVRAVESRSRMPPGPRRLLDAA